MLIADGPYLTGEDITIADYLGAELLACGDLIRVNWRRYPKVEGWLTTMKSRPAWADVHELIDGYAASLAEKNFFTIDWEQGRGTGLKRAHHRGAKQIRGW